MVNVPAIGESPAIQQLNEQFPGLADAANFLTVVFNSGLVQLQQDLNQSLPGVDIIVSQINNFPIELVKL